MRGNIKSFIIGLGAVIGLVGVGVAVDTTVRASGGDCGPNSVVKCGVANSSELVAALRTYPQLMARYGMTRDSKAVEGTVTKSGDVIVGGKVIATGAHSVGRQYMAGSKKITADGQIFYDRSTSVSFNSASLPAYVFVKSDGTFSGAVIKDCGNPVAATPKVTPKPTPKPTPTPTPTPVYTCDSLSVSRINNSRSEYSYTAKATAKDGAVIKDYAFTFGDGATATSTSATVNHTYAKPGTYKASVTVNVVVGGKTVTTTGPGCQTSIVIAEEVKNIQVCDITAKKIISIKENEFDASRHTRDLSKCEDMQVCVLETKKVTTIKKSEYDSTKHSTQLSDCEEKPTPPPTPTPTPEVPVAELPQTGIVDAFNGVLGLGSVVAASLYYRSSRRVL